MTALSRRGALGLSLAGAGLVLQGCSRIVHADQLNSSAAFQHVLSFGEAWTLDAQRFLLRGGQLAREYTPADLSRTFKANGTLHPAGPAYARAVADGFSSWRLQIGGLVERPLALSVADLRALPARTQITRHDCVETAAASTPRAVDEALPLDLARRQTLAPGVRLLAGPWNVIEVVTAAGNYVIEGPISNRYSDQVMASVQAGGQRLLGVITTSDAWPHIAGLRAYASAGVPIYALDLNRPLLERLMAAPHRQRPDSLARRGRRADIRSVARDLDLGSGPNRMRLIPLRTASGERQMAIYFPELKLLYTSDLFSVRPDGTIFLPEFLSEMRSVVLREGLDLKTAVGMHYGPADWTALGR